LVDPDRQPTTMRMAGAGIELAGAVLVAAYLGSLLDRKMAWGTPWGLLLGGLLGFVVGMANLFRLVLRMNR
jgi:F0F1-type ATP synthase assembly protein I